MLLQPIVENAIFHGIAPKDADGSIDIEVEQNGKNIVVKITDDGIGIDEGRLHQLQMNDKERSNKGMTNIGLNHVHQTIQLYYGSTYGLSISSIKNEGTRVLITIADSKEETYVQSAIG